MRKLAIFLFALLFTGTIYAQPVSIVELISGGTNNVAASTTNQVYGPILCERNLNVAFEFCYRMDAAKTTNVVFRLFRSMDTTGTNLVNYPLRTIGADTAPNGDFADIVLAPFGTTNTCTNVAVTVGATPYLYLKVTNPNSGAAITNLKVRYTTIRGL